MKKLLSIFSTVLLTSAISTSTIACSKTSGKKHSLKNDLTNTQLGIINERNPGTLPTMDELLASLHDKNLNLNISNISLSNEDVDKVDVTGDGKFYEKDTITVNFQETTLNINNLITEGTDLGKILPKKDVVTSEQIKAAIHQQISAVDINHIKVDITIDNNATISGDNIVYNGSVGVIFTTDNSVALSSIIDSSKPVSVATLGQDVATDKQIIKALQDMYKNLNTNFVEVTNITSENAIVQSKKDQTKYRGSVKIKLNLDKIVDLSSVINHGLAKVAVTGKSITIDDVKKSLQKEYTTLNINAIIITLTNNNKTVNIHSINKAIYIGDDVVINSLLIDLNSVLAPTLPKFYIPREKVPSLQAIKETLTKNDPNLIIDNIIIGVPSSTNVVITGDGKFYSKDAINVKYTCDSSVPLSKDFTNLDLGAINSNGLMYVNEQKVRSAISNANPNLNMKAIKVSDISANQVVVDGDGITYTGSVTAKFTIDSSTINITNLNYNHTETNKSGSLKENWIGPDQVILNNWTHYASDWNSFTTKFTKLSFGKDASFGIFCNTYCDKKLTGSELDVNTNKISEDRNVNMFYEDFSYDNGWLGAVIELHGQLHIWHDATKIYVNYTGNADTSKCFRDRVLNVFLPSATFSK